MKGTKDAKKNKGITLIALVITIIIMILLISVTITMAVNGGLFEHASNKSAETQNAINKEQEIATGANIEGNIGYYYQKKWDEKAAPEDAFVWKSNDPNNEDYGVIVGYRASIDNYPTLRFPTRCTKIMLDDAYIIGSYSERDEIRSYTKNIREVELPNTLTELGDDAFSLHDFKSLKNITIPESVTSIGEYAFDGCTSLKSIHIPESVTSIGNCAFQNILLVRYSGTATGSPWGAGVAISNEKLKQWDGAKDWDEKAAPEDAFVWQSDDPNDDGYRIVVGYTSKVDNYPTLRFPSRCAFVAIDRDGVKGTSWEEITQIRSYTKNIKEIELPETVVGIGDFAFWNSSNFVYSLESLEKITLPSSLVSIGKNAFCDCNKLTEITIPDSVNNIGDWAFSYTQHIYYNGTATGSPWGAGAIN